MIIFVGGLIGAGKSTIARGLSERLGLPYYDVDEVKKVVYRQDPDFEKNIREGIPFSDERRIQVFEAVCKDLEKMIESAPHIVVDETLHRRETRHVLYDHARRISDGFIVIWVHADEQTILERLGSQNRTGHLLDDPLPLHHAFREQFEDYRRCVVDCPNNGSVDDAVGDLVGLIRSIGALSQATSPD